MDKASNWTYLICCEGVQAGGGLVQEQHPGVCHEGKADVGALALPSCTSTRQGVRRPTTPLYTSPSPHNVQDTTGTVASCGE